MMWFSAVKLKASSSPQANISLLVSKHNMQVLQGIDNCISC
jgi:hypothetical protein